MHAELEFDSACRVLTAGCRAPSAEQLEALDRQGWVALPPLGDAGWLRALRSDLELALGPADHGSHSRQGGTRHARGLEGRGEMYLRAALDGRVLALVRHVLPQPFRMIQLAARDPLPGFGQQALHADWLPRAPGAGFDAVTVLWAVDEFTATNGATRVVPASHLDPRPVPRAYQSPAAAHPSQRQPTLPAGSVLVLNGHLWHSGMQNKSGGSRRALQIQYVTRKHARTVPVRLPPGTPPEAFAVLDG